MPTIEIPQRHGQSSLYAWLWRHWSEIEPRVVGKTDWATFADQLMKNGLRGRNGRPLSGEIVRKTFARVEAAKSADTN